MVHVRHYVRIMDQGGDHSKKIFLLFFPGADTLSVFAIPVPALALDFR